MMWDRSWVIIRKVQRNEIPDTPGWKKYLESEIARMSPAQRARFYQETIGNGVAAPEGA